jgi:hypothetical protein
VLACDEIWSENRGVKCSYSIPLFVVALCVTSIMLLGADFKQSQSPDSTRATSDAPVYFPPDLPVSSFFSQYLAFLGEPSLLEISKNKAVVSYRLSWLGGQTGRVVAVRLIVNSDGGGEVVSEAASGSPSVVHKGSNVISAADLERILQLVEDGKFWSMRSTEQNRGYQLDGTVWIVEGVRNGSYHCVYRRSPDAEPGQFSEIGRYLAKDLAKLDDSTIYIRRRTSTIQ